ncbi:MAG: hypothetical protein WBA13_01225 [Microcoleaceae cyanobacterium]
MQELSLAAIFLGIVLAVITDRKPSHSSHHDNQHICSQFVNVGQQPQPKNITINVYESEEKHDT